MVEISNKDAAAAVTFLACYTQTAHDGSTREINKRRRAKNLIYKLQKKILCKLQDKSNTSGSR